MKLIIIRSCTGEKSAALKNTLALADFRQDPPMSAPANLETTFNRLSTKLLAI